VGDKKVLVIEDNPLNMKLVRQLITIGHYDVVEAFTAEDGISQARKIRPDLILMDIQLPDMDGLTAVKVIKDDPAISEIPIIALTAHAMRGDDLKARAAGCSDYLSKPIDTKLFFKTLQKYLDIEPQADRIITEDVAESKKALCGPTILVVDDDPLNVKLLAAKLGASGNRILTAYNGFEALEIIKTRTPDLILLDIMMPGMDGYEVIKRLKEQKDTKHIPIILITALESEEEKKKGFAAGADEFLNKPVNTTELETRVLSLLRMKKYQEQLSARIQAEKDVIGKAVCNDSNEESQMIPTVLVVEDNAKDAHIIEHYLNGMQLNLKIVRTGMEALDIIGNEKIDLVLLDIMLPDLDGMDICRKIKESEKTLSVQVVIVTSFDDMKMKIRGIEEGADDFLVKPLNPDEIRARVTALLRKKLFMDRLNQRANAALQAAINDELTGVHNHAYFKHILELEIKRSRRHENKMALLMLDVDNFKRFNDAYGHPAGDRALMALGSALKDNVRDVDVVARYGGEEFAVVLPYAGWSAGRQVAERLLETINKQKILIDSGGKETAGISISIGLAVFPDNGISAESIVNAADSALYDAKRKGKNRACCADIKMPLALGIR
jgi:two-component system cell cycle response regulator